MSIIKKISQNTHYILGIIFGISLFFIGKFRISTGLNSISDPNLIHYTNTGLLYIQISLLILVALAVGITYSLTKSKNDKGLKK